MSSASDASSSEVSSLAGDQPEETWQDWEEDESEGFKSLFDGARFPSLEEVLAHDDEAHAFNLRKYRRQVGERSTVWRSQCLNTAAAAPDELLRRALCHCWLACPLAVCLCPWIGCSSDLINWELSS